VSWEAERLTTGQMRIANENDKTVTSHLHFQDGSCLYFDLSASVTVGALEERGRV